MPNKKLHGEIAGLLERYGFVAIIKVLEIEAARRHLKWSRKPDRYPLSLADRMGEIRKILSTCLRHLARGA